MTKVVEEGKTKPMADPEVVSTSEAARQLGVSVRTIQLWVESGKLEAWKTAGNHRRVYQHSIDDYKAGRTVGDDQVLAVGRFEPWLVIVDIDMPELDGIEVVMAMRQKGLSDRVRVVVISNVPYEEARRRGLPADCPFYPKPISLEDFSQAVAQARADYTASN